MDFLLFEDDDLDLMHQAINKLQLCFHPTYAPMGHFSVHDLFDIQNQGAATKGRAFRRYQARTRTSAALWR